MLRMISYPRRPQADISRAISTGHIMCYRQAGPDLLPSLLPWCYIEKLEPLRCEVSEKRHLSIGVARENTGLVSFPGHYQMLAAGNLSEFIARQGLVAIELQSELALA